MKLDLMFTASEDILSRCRQPRREVMELVSAVVDKKHYGTTLDLLLVNVVIQDAGLIKLGTKLSRKSKDIRVDVPLSWKWVKCAQDSEIRLALLECLVKAVEITKQRLTRKDDDFDAEKLIVDLKAVVDRLDGRIE
jgi:hypothetical protein